MTFKIVNLTPHPVSIVRGDHSATYPAAAPEDLPTAIDGPVYWLPLGSQPHIPGDDSQTSYAILCQLGECPLVDRVGYTGVRGLPPFPSLGLGDGISTAYIVSVVTAIGALAAGRPIYDLLIPSGQVRDAQGRIIGATGLAPAECVLGRLMTRL